MIKLRLVNVGRKEVGVSSDGLVWRAIDKGSFDGRLSFLQAELDDGYLIEFGLIGKLSIYCYLLLPLET